MNPLAILLICLAYIVSTEGAGHLATVDGQLVMIVDDCTPGDDSTCPVGECCVKEGMAYIPEATGPKPAYQISCMPYRKSGEFCYNMQTTEMCPCDAGLTCLSTSSTGLFGHCH